jgi:hypothetical protein
MKRILIPAVRFCMIHVFVCVSIASTVWGQRVQKCDMDILLATSRKMGTLEQEEIKKFLLTLGTSCRQNVEFSEWSNEILFSLFDKQTGLTMRTIEAMEESIEVQEILNELTSPVSDAIAVRRIITKVERVKISSGLKKEILESLNAAAEKTK